MQTIWSRAASVPSRCRCSQCLGRVQAGLSRRVTATASNRVGAARLQPTATFTYTSIFLAATVVDQSIKNERRAEWDRKIATAKEEIAAHEAAHAEIEATEPRTTAGETPWRQEEEDWKTDRGAAKNLMQETRLPTTQPPAAVDPDHEHLGYTTVATELRRAHEEGVRFDRNDDWLRMLEYDFDPDFEGKTALWPAEFGSKVNLRRVGGNSIYSERRQRIRALRRIWTPKKQRLMENTIEWFVYSLIHQYQSELLRPEVKVDLPVSISKILEKNYEEREAYIKYLRKRSDGELKLIHPTEVDHDRDTLPTYHMDDQCHFLKTLNDLNQHLKDLISQVIDQTLSKTNFLVQVCESLLHCPYPPNINTINVLCAGFVKLKMETAMNLLYLVIRIVGVRPNEITHTWVLRFFIDSNNVAKFTRWIQLMRGDDCGLMLAHPRATLDTESMTTRRLRKGNPSKIIQKVYPTQMILKEILRGLLHFADLDTAMAVYNTLRQDSWPLSWDMLLLFLDRAATDADWAHGTAIWQAMTPLHLPRWHSANGHIIRATLARLCRACGRPDELPALMAMHTPSAEQTSPTAADRNPNVHRIISRDKAPPYQRAPQPEQPSTTMRWDPQRQQSAEAAEAAEGEWEDVDEVAEPAPALAHMAADVSRATVAVDAGAWPETAAPARWGYLQTRRDEKMQMVAV